MNAKFAIAISAAALVMGAGAAQAAVGGKYAEPSQPVAYGQLNTYLKTSPSQRAHRDFTGGQTAQAATGQPMDTAATTMNNPPPAAAAAQPMPAQSMPAQSAPASTMTQPSASQTMNPDNNLNMPANADTSNTTAPSTPDVNEPTASQK